MNENRDSIMRMARGAAGVGLVNTGNKEEEKDHE